MNFLIVEDDPVMAQMITHGLAPLGGTVTHKSEAEEGLKFALQTKYDAIVLDLLLPKMDGFTFIEKLREAGRTTPVLVVSSLSEIEPKVKSLTIGGDDFVAKPFHQLELQARVQNLIRRSKRNDDTLVSTYGELHVDRIQRLVHRLDQKIELQEHEFLLLDLLLENAGEIVSKSAILKKVWNYEFDPQTNVVDVLVCRLRNKIDRGFNQKLIQTIRGQGYILRNPDNN